MIPRALISPHLRQREGEVAATATLHRLLGSRSRGPTAVSASLIRRFDLCFCLGSGVASGDCASGAGSATGSAVPLITTFAMAFSPCLEKSLSNAQITASHYASRAFVRQGCLSG